MIQDVEKMIQAALGQIEGVLDSKSVVGEPVTVGEYTIVPSYQHRIRVWCWNRYWQE